MTTGMDLFSTLSQVNGKMVVMWLIGALLIYLGIRKKMEPALLIPIGFGAILVNLPFSGAVTQLVAGVLEEGPLDTLFQAGIANELFLLILFIGLGAMIDFSPLLAQPYLAILGLAAQAGIFITLFLARGLGFSPQDAASVGIIGAADGPTAIFVANHFSSRYIGTIVVTAYSYMALVPLMQPLVVRLLTTRKERLIRMPSPEKMVSRRARILFPILVTAVAGLLAPRSAALIGFLMFGNLIRECGVLEALSETARNVVPNLITLLLGLTVASRMRAEDFLSAETLMILGLGLAAFVFDMAGGILVAKLLNLFLKRKVNPMLGACGISAFPMAARGVTKLALSEDPENVLLMPALGVNVAGQIASVIAGGILMGIIPR
ncbi:MAG: sodium ion-translocating decarboxylase subunit beta [Lachnospiraceae bacterium]|nr:sodium ion-translocating decarboxylase subunit beta [Lachnospiraceae bacterium]